MALEQDDSKSAPMKRYILTIDTIGSWQESYLVEAESEDKAREMFNDGSYVWGDLLSNTSDEAEIDEIHLGDILEVIDMEKWRMGTVY